MGLKRFKKGCGTTVIENGLLLDTICLTLCLFFFSGGQVAKLYRDASLGNVVNIIVTRLIVLTEDQVRKTLFLLRHLVCFYLFSHSFH